MQINVLHYDECEYVLKRHFMVARVKHSASGPMIRRCSHHHASSFQRCHGNKLKLLICRIMLRMLPSPVVQHTVHCYRFTAKATYPCVATTKPTNKTALFACVILPPSDSCLHLYTLQMKIFIYPLFITYCRQCRSIVYLCLLTFCKANLVNITDCQADGTTHAHTTGAYCQSLQDLSVVKKNMY